MIPNYYQFFKTSDSDYLVTTSGISHPKILAFNIGFSVGVSIPWVIVLFSICIKKKGILKNYFLYRMSALWMQRFTSGHMQSLSWFLFLRHLIDICPVYKCSFLIEIYLSKRCPKGWGERTGHWHYQVLKCVPGTRSVYQVSKSSLQFFKIINVRKHEAHRQ